MSRDNDNLCWFHENLDREAAEDLMKREGKENGTFLVRPSTTAAGDYVLTLLYKGDVCHYQIRRHGEDAIFSIDDKVRILHGLDTLIDFYREESHGLVTKLTSFIKQDPPPNHTRSHGVTNLLHRATNQNEKTVVTELLKCGYRNIEAKNQFGQTALHLASIHCDEQILKLFLEAHVAVNVMDADGNMPLHYACRDKSSSFIRLLINANANIQGRNINNGYVPLHEAAKYGNLQAVQELLNSNAPLLPRTKYGEFPLDLAKEHNQLEVVEYLSNYKLPPAKTYQSQWYHGTLKREEAVEVLKSFALNMIEEAKNHNLEQTQVNVDTSGCFLIRFSEKNKSCGYVLTLLWNDQVKHYQIGQSSKFLFIDEGPYLPTLEHLVEHFMRFADGLPVNLKHPVKPKPKPPLPLFSTMPRAGKKKSENLLASPTIMKQPMTSMISPTALADKDVCSASPQQSLSQSFANKRKAGSSVFNSLKITSPRKNKFDINSLRKSKSKSKKEESSHNDSPADVAPDIALQRAQTLFKSLSFSTDFINCQNETGEFYNVPKNNAVVNKLNEIQEACDEPPGLSIENKTEQEIEYFTKSDLIIERERLTTLAIKEERNDTTPSLVDANGYVPTVDIRVFLDPIAGSICQETLEASSAELRQLSIHPERLDSFVSQVSTESEVMRYFNRQSSTMSSVSDVATSGKLNYFIPQECLELEEIIGEGEFGAVYKGFLVRKQDKIDDQNIPEMRCQVAIKTLRDEHCRSNKQEFLREASVMIRLHHHCVVQLIGISKGESLMMVQELVPLGSMLQYIIENRSDINPNFELKLWASQIACGMEYLETQHFVHRDLAARNILLASRNQAKISDFGLSRALITGNDCYQASQGGKWPIKWYAPESFNNGIFSHASDVWSFGITLWEMFSLGEPPYGEIRGIQAIELIEKGERLSKPRNCPDNVYEIMKSCWNYKPRDRPTFRFLTEFFAKDPDYQNICELIRTEHIR